MSASSQMNDGIERAYVGSLPCVSRGNVRDHRLMRSGRRRAWSSDNRDNVMTIPEQVRNQSPAHEAIRAGDKNSRHCAPVAATR